MSRLPVRVVSAAQAAARDAHAIAAPIPSRALMQRAGAAAAAEIALRFPEQLTRGVSVFVGPGNNGGDGWVVARALAAAGVDVRVVEPVPARSPDCLAERALALDTIPDAGAASDGAALVVDALLGTGSSGAPRGEIASAVERIARARHTGAVVVALDLPTGVDATDGAGPAHVAADLTLTFGTVKRGHLLARAACGHIVVLDIGLGRFAECADGAGVAVDERWVAEHVPSIAHDAHKGTRGRVAVIGGSRGMAGAAVLAGRGALRGGAGLVRLVVERASVEAVQQGEPAALAAAWPVDDEAGRRDVIEWADAVAVGPGLGDAREARALLERVLREWRGPLVLDADALNAYAGRLDALAPALDGRPALLTPHPAELARLLGVDVSEVVARRFDIGAEAAARARAVVLLKGVPTVVSTPDGETLVSASGTPALATGGSGDVLTGIAAALLAQMPDAAAAGACAAWVHGRAASLAEQAVGAQATRGATLDDVLGALPRAWSLRSSPTRYPVLFELDSP